MLARGLEGIVKTRGVANLPDQAALVDEARAAFNAAPQGFDALRQALQTRYPGVDERAMGYAVWMLLPLVQVPTDDPWGFPGHAAFTTAASWLGSEPDAAECLPALVHRYLAAFGPASVADMKTWSGLQGLKPFFEALRPSLRMFKDERGRELFDVPDAPRPGGEVDAPIRYLPAFDNLLLGHDDRTRVIADGHRPRVCTKNLQVLPTFLVDGVVAGTWRVNTTRTKATLVLSPFAPIAPAVRDALVAEGEHLVRFLEPDIRADVAQEPMKRYIGIDFSRV
jgi:hypothetical protein